MDVILIHSYWPITNENVDFQTTEKFVRLFTQTFKLSPDHTRVALVSTDGFNSASVESWFGNYTNNADFWQRAVDQWILKRISTRNEDKALVLSKVFEEARACVAKIAITFSYSQHDYYYMTTFSDTDEDPWLRSPVIILAENYYTINMIGKLEAQVLSIFKSACQKAGKCSEYFVCVFLVN